MAVFLYAAATPIHKHTVGTRGNTSKARAHARARNCLTPTSEEIIGQSASRTHLTASFIDMAHKSVRYWSRNPSFHPCGECPVFGVIPPAIHTLSPLLSPEQAKALTVSNLLSPKLQVGVSIYTELAQWV